ncbi:hypothetical protein Salat_0601300 [Sesamum alatum]|uniref:Uncharacterized protein n=1 Tax=Sesamum alatum TaxID=300844 RepID=A0AAE1YPS6_9LAMI|nr:hypothetical protein Salat_0601300 [Sesamum alatum]
MAWPRYPPCVSFGCACIQCCGQGKYKVRWPELLGKTPEEATPVIVSDNPLVTVVPVPKGSGMIQDFCCNRVWLLFDGNNRVFEILLSDRSNGKMKILVRMNV